MAKFRKHYDLDHIVKTCYERSGADKNELYEFETTTDLQNIPNSHALKVYLRCFAEVSGTMEVKSNKMILTKFLDFWEDLKQADQEIYLNMGKGCLKRAKSVTDRLEFSYTLMVCAKQNDNEVNWMEFVLHL